MATAPHLVREGEELKLDASVGTTRRRFDLSDRALTLLTAELDYGKADVLPWVTARALVLAGGATLPEGSDARDTAWSLTGAEGGREATGAELDALAEYLGSVRVPDRSLETLREHVRGTRLSEFLDPGDVQGRTSRVQDLSDIARDL